MNGAENNTNTNDQNQPQPKKFIAPPFVVFVPINPEEAFAWYSANAKKQREMEQQMMLKMQLHDDLRDFFGGHDLPAKKAANETQRKAATNEQLRRN